MPHLLLTLSERNRHQGRRTLRASNKKVTTTTVSAELVGSNRATAQNVALTSPTPVLDLCSALVAGGVDPATSLEAYRGDTLLLRSNSISRAARLEPSPNAAAISETLALRRTGTTCFNRAREQAAVLACVLLVRVAVITNED